MTFFHVVDSRYQNFILLQCRILSIIVKAQ